MNVEAAFAALEAPLLAYARRLLEDPEMAQDTVQEAFLRLHAQFPEVREPRPWLYRTVHNLALNHRRASGRIVPFQPATPGGTEPEPVDPQRTPDEELSRREAVGQVQHSLAALDSRSREVVLLKFRDDLSYQQISDRTGLTSGHVGYLLHHALKALASELSRTGLLP